MRDIYEIDDARLLLVATDRISAFDVVLPTPIPGKGRVLTQLSAFWFRKLPAVPNHFLAADIREFPETLRSVAEMCGGRAMLVRRAAPLPVEWVVRGYLAGSAWSEYRSNGTVGGIAMASGLAEHDRLPEPALTPTSKAAVGEGHDAPLAWGEVEGFCGVDIARQARDAALNLYSVGSAHARTCGVIVADTKFEFGLANGSLMLIDECFTPDSSRFWPADAWVPGRSTPSFDKQYVRDYLVGLAWNRAEPGPELPPDVVRATAQRYEEALRLLAH